MRNTSHGWWFFGSIITMLLLGPAVFVVLLAWIIVANSNRKYNQRVKHEQNCAIIEELKKLNERK